MDIFKEDNHKLVISAGFVCFNFPFKKYCRTGFCFILCLRLQWNNVTGFQQKMCRDNNEHIAINEHIVHSFSLSCPHFLEKRNLRQINTVWQLLLISYHVNNYSHLQAAESRCRKLPWLCFINIKRAAYKRCHSEQADKMMLYAQG